MALSNTVLHLEALYAEHEQPPPCPIDSRDRFRSRCHRGLSTTATKDVEAGHKGSIGKNRHSTCSVQTMAAVPRGVSLQRIRSWAAVKFTRFPFERGTVFLFWRR